MRGVRLSWHCCTCASGSVADQYKTRQPHTPTAVRRAQERSHMSTRQSQDMELPGSAHAHRTCNEDGQWDSQIHYQDWAVVRRRHDLHFPLRLAFDSHPRSSPQNGGKSRQETVLESTQRGRQEMKPTGKEEAHFATTDGHRLWYETWRADQDPASHAASTATVVFLHGDVAAAPSLLYKSCLPSGRGCGLHVHDLPNRAWCFFFRRARERRHRDRAAACCRLHCARAQVCCC